MLKGSHDSESPLANLDAQAFALFMPLFNALELSENMYLSPVCYFAFNGSIMGSGIAGEVLACTLECVLLNFLIGILCSPKGDENMIFGTLAPLL